MKNKAIAFSFLAIICIAIPFARGETGTMRIYDVVIETDTNIRSAGSPVLFRVQLEERSGSGCFSDEETETVVSGTPRLPFSFLFDSSNRQALRYADYLGSEWRYLYFLYVTETDDSGACECRFKLPLSLVDGATIVRTNANNAASWRFVNEPLSDSCSIDIRNETENRMNVDGVAILGDTYITSIEGGLWFEVHLHNDGSSDEGFDDSETIVTGSPTLPFHLNNASVSAIRYADYIGYGDRCLYFRYQTVPADDGALEIDFDLPLQLNGASIVRSNLTTGKTWTFSNRAPGNSYYNGYYNQDYWRNHFYFDFHGIETPDSSLDLVVGEKKTVRVSRSVLWNSNAIRLQSSSDDGSIASVSGPASFNGEEAFFSITGISEGSTSVRIETLLDYPRHDLSYSVRVHKAPVVTDVSIQQRYPWNGLVDISFELDSDTNCKIDLSAVVEGTGEEIPVSSVSVYGTDSTDLTMSPGTCHLVWNAGRDVPGRKIDAIRLSVKASPVY